MPEKITFPLELVLTPDGFVPELPGSRHTEDGEALLARWKENRCKELFHLGQRERPEGLSLRPVGRAAPHQVQGPAVLRVPWLHLAGGLVVAQGLVHPAPAVAHRAL